MSDIFSSEKRSEIMHKVRSRDNKSTEQALIRIFRDYQITGWRRHYNVKGHPDFVFIKKRIAVFVDGCFWHGHDCRNTRPSSNEAYWIKKRQRNIQHDKDVNNRFITRNWTVLRIWECELRKKNASILHKKLCDAGLLDPQ